MIKKPLLGPKRAKENRKMHWEGSSEHLRKALDLSKVVTRRFQIVAVAVCVAMSVIVARLFTIQMLQTEDSHYNCQSPSNHNILLK